MSALLCCLRRRRPSQTDEVAEEPAPVVNHLQVVREALRYLEANPDDKRQQEKVQETLGRQPSAVYDVLQEEAIRLPLVVPQQTTTSLAGPDSPTLLNDVDWANCIGEQRCTPLNKVRPQSLQDMVDIVNEARRLKQRVRAVGSGHAFSDVARTDGAVLVNPILLNDVRAVNTALLRVGAVEGGNTLVYVQAGITVKNLKVELDNRGLALINMGGYDGQTISGTLSTGTHGSGITFGPLASFARAIILVSESGTVYQIEPTTGGVSDPAKFLGVLDSVPVQLKQSDAWFRTAHTSMGCLGLIHAYILEVTPAYSIRELRTSTTWSTVRLSLLPSMWSPVPEIVSSSEHFELILNPYTRWFRNACLTVSRTRLPGADHPQSGQRQDWLTSLLQQIAVEHTADLVALLRKFPFLSPLAIDQAIMSVSGFDGDGDGRPDPYVDKSFNVFTLGAAANEITALAMELHCDAARCVPTIDALLEAFHDMADREGWYMAGPLGVRFVAASEGYLAPQAGRMTCTVELAMLVGLEAGRDLARRVKERLCTSDEGSVRVHWGLDLDFVTAEDARAWYPDFERWVAVYRTLNSTGMFNNQFTNRLRISISP